MSPIHIRHLNIAMAINSTFLYLKIAIAVRKIETGIKTKTFENVFLGVM